MYIMGMGKLKNTIGEMYNDIPYIFWLIGVSLVFYIGELLYQ